MKIKNKTLFIIVTIVIVILVFFSIKQYHKKTIVPVGTVFIGHIATGIHGQSAYDENPIPLKIKLDFTNFGQSKFAANEINQTMKIMGIKNSTGSNDIPACHVMGLSALDANSSRIKIKVENISCIYSSGFKFTRGINGYAVDYDDQKAGIKTTKDNILEPNTEIIIVTRTNFEF